MCNSERIQGSRLQSHWGNVSCIEWQCVCLVCLPLQSHDPPESCRCQGRCRGSQSRFWRNQTSRAGLYLWVQIQEEILIYYLPIHSFHVFIRSDSRVSTKNALRGKTCLVYCWNAFNLKCTEEGSTVNSNKQINTAKKKGENRKATH